MAHIDPETEDHRSLRTLTHLYGNLPFPLAKGVVAVRVDPDVASRPVGQKLTVMVVHHLLRMKGIIPAVALSDDLADVPILLGTPLQGSSLLEGLEQLTDSLNHTHSVHHARLDRSTSSDLVIGIGQPGDVVAGADGWRAFTGAYAEMANWSQEAPFGAYMAASIVTAQALQLLIARHTNGTKVQAEDTAHSLFDHTFGSTAQPGPDLAHLTLSDVTLGGAGAGGTAALYTLGSLPHLDGDITIVEPGRHKMSNLNRYLMARADDVHDETHKLATAVRHLGAYAPDLDPTLVDESWQERKRSTELIIATVDTLEGRHAIQQDANNVVLEAGVDGYLFTALRVTPGGFCIGCKLQPDAEERRAAANWNMNIDEYRRKLAEDTFISEKDVARLEDIQNVTSGTFSDLLGRTWREAAVPVACGDARITPQQVGSIPMATTAAGVVIAAETAKHLTRTGEPLNNWLERDLRYAPSDRNHRRRRVAVHCTHHE